MPANIRRKEAAACALASRNRPLETRLCVYDLDRDRCFWHPRYPNALTTISPRTTNADTEPYLHLQYSSMTSIYQEKHRLEVLGRVTTPRPESFVIGCTWPAGM